MGFQDTFNARVIPAGNRAFGLSATLARAGVGTTDSFTVTWEKQEYEVVDEQGFLTKVASRDFMFDKSAIVLDSTTVEPREGDQLVITENGAQRKYEILPFGKMPACESEPGNFRWRVRTKEVA